MYAPAVTAGNVNVADVAEDALIYASVVMAAAAALAGEMVHRGVTPEPKDWSVSTTVCAAVHVAVMVGVELLPATLTEVHEPVPALLTVP